MLTFEAYWPLVLLLGLPLILWLARRQRTSLSPRRVRVAAWLRAGVLTALTLALMRPAWQRPEQQVAVVYAVDVSHSMSTAYLRSALEAIAQADAQGSAGFRRYVVFGDRARVLERAEDIANIAVRGEDDSTPARGVIDQGLTDIEGALTTAVLSFPAQMERHLVLISDGHQTRGDVWRLLPRLQAEHVRVFTLPAQGAAGTDAWVAALHLPEVLREREPFLLHAQVHARAAAAASVELRQGDRLLDRQAVQLAAGENEVLFETQLSGAGAHALTVKVIMAGDEVVRNDAMSRNIWVAPALRVLHVGAAEAPLAQALVAQGLQVKAIDAEQLATVNLSAFDTILLNDVPAEKLKGVTGERLEALVRDQGVGLVFVAGENAYGKSAYAGSAVERLLPIKFEGKRKRKDLDLVLLIDRSYSMRGKKLEIAKTAALSTLDLLEPQHRFAVVGFDARPHDVVPLAEVGGKRRAEDLISSMTAGGQTNVYNALFYAHRLLEKSTAKTKHIILLSDGVTALAPGGGGRSSSEEQMAVVQRSRQDFFDRWRREHPGQPLPGVDDLPPEPPPGTFEELASNLLRDKITLSTVALGDKPNLQLLANLANWAEGKSYVAASDNEIPGLFISEAQRLLGESMVEELFRPLVKVNGAALTGLDFATGPALKGFIVSKPKRFADVLLEGKRNLPLLVETRYGLGKTVAFLSDARNRWAADWLAWPGYGKLWSQVVRDAARRDSGQTLRWDLKREDDEALITLTALTAEGRPRDGLAPVVRVDAGSDVVPLRQSAPGVYTERVRLDAQRANVHGFELVASGGLTAQEIGQAGPRTLVLDDGEEYRAVGTDQVMLRRLSEATGGVFAPALQDIRRHYGDGGLRSTPLWWGLAVIALLLYLVELFVRRSPWGLRLRSPDQ